MAGRRGRSTDVNTEEEFDALVAGGARSMRGWRLQDLDLTQRTGALRRLDASGALFLGCLMAPAAEASVQAEGALVFPSIPELPFEPYRSGLYSPDELYAGIRAQEYSSTPDARIYAWSRQQDADESRTPARALHDHAIDVARSTELTSRRSVGVMGGHAVSRRDADYGDAARLGWTLTRDGCHVVSGGGPGAMEAANLGAYLSGYAAEALAAALEVLKRAPSFMPSVTEWARAAFDVRARWADGRESLGIPTWFYGHEPPTPFASSIAKYFQNSVREDTLLRHCNGGIIFLTGAAGTVQEIFQDGCENYYAEGATIAPMVLVARAHWTREVPAWPLLSKLAEGRPMAEHIHLVDTVDEAVQAVRGGEIG